MKKEKELQYFEIQAKGGHAKGGKAGKEYYVDLILPVVARNRKEAAEKARQMPRVKHHDKKAIGKVVKINKKRYDEIRRMNDEDPYYSCHNIQDQRRLCPDLEILREPRAEERDNQDGHKHRMSRKKYWTHYVDHYDLDVA